MRTALLIVLGGLTLSAAGTAPEQIVFSRVFPQPNQIGLFIAAAHGRDEHPLLSPGGMDYDASWSPDGGWSVFTSERSGSADLYRVTPDGSGLERLTDLAAYDDQAAFSPDGRQAAWRPVRTPRPSR